MFPGNVYELCSWRLTYLILHSSRAWVELLVLFGIILIKQIILNITVISFLIIFLLVYLKIRLWLDKVLYKLKLIGSNIRLACIFGYRAQNKPDFNFFC